MYDSISKRIYKIDKWLLYEIAVFATTIWMSLLAMLLNLTTDISFVRLIFSLPASFCAGFFVIYLFKNIYKKVTFKIIAVYFVFAVSIQMVLAIFMFLNPVFRNIILELEYHDELTQTVLVDVVNKNIRFIGLGNDAMFFGGGIINGFALILIGLLLKKENVTFKEVLIYILLYIIILFSGSIMSRTTIIGGILGFIAFIIPVRKRVISKITRKIKTIFASVLCISIILVLLINFLPKERRIQLEKSIKYGFEYFVTYSESGSLETASTNALFGSINFPKNYKTYLIGDGYFADPINPKNAYYMEVDTGYLRLLYYFGLVGLLLYLFIDLIPICYFAKKEKSDIGKRFFVVLLIYLLILNIKGLSTIFQFTILFCFIANVSTEKSRNDLQKGKFACFKLSD
jgi:hypothetical protein